MAIILPPPGGYSHPPIENCIFLLPAKSESTLLEDAVREAYAEEGIEITDILSAVEKYKLWKMSKNGGR